MSGKLLDHRVPKALRKNQSVQQANDSLVHLSNMELNKEKFFGLFVKDDKTWIY